MYEEKKEKVLEVGFEPTTVALLLKTCLKGPRHRNFGEPNVAISTKL